MRGERKPVRMAQIRTSLESNGKTTERSGGEIQAAGEILRKVDVGEGKGGG